jgi:hypothetical protein
MGFPEDWPIERPGTVLGRERILAEVERGNLTPDEAEDWARENNLRPFAASPDVALFDPLQEPRWTLAMAAAWIIWKTPEYVRKYWSKYRKECRVWKRRFLPSEGKKSGSYIGRPGPAGAQDILRDVSKDHDRSVRALGAIDELISTFVAGRIVAIGTPTKDHPGKLPPLAIAIPKEQWAMFSLYADFGSSKDSVGSERQKAPFYDDVSVERDMVLNLWERESSNKDEGNAIRGLALQFRENPQLTRDGAKAWLVSNGFKISAAGFQNRVWPKAREKAGLAAKASPGPKKTKKSSRLPETNP